MVKLDLFMESQTERLEKVQKLVYIQKTGRNWMLFEMTNYLKIKLYLFQLILIK